jgi:hypothetical protein
VEADSSVGVPTFYITDATLGKVWWTGAPGGTAEDVAKTLALAYV